MKTTEKKSNISITNNRKVKVFLFILVLTSIIWLLIELSKSYTSSATFSVDYKNIPIGKLLQSSPISEINIVLKAPGFSISWKVLARNSILIWIPALQRCRNRPLIPFYMAPMKPFRFTKKHWELLHIITSTLRASLILSMVNLRIPLLTPSNVGPQVSWIMWIARFARGTDWKRNLWCSRWMVRILLN